MVCFNSSIFIVFIRNLWILFLFFQDAQPAGETSGICELQLETEPKKRNCRYGKCEQIKNGTDFACHCDDVSRFVFYFMMMLSAIFYFFIQVYNRKKVR